MRNPVFALGLVLLGASLSVHGQTTTASGTASQTSLQLLTTIGASPPNSTTASVSGSASASGNSTSTRTGTGTTSAANVTAVVPNQGINPSTAVPSEFPRNGAFGSGPVAAHVFVAAAGLAAFATLCL